MASEAERIGGLLARQHRRLRTGFRAWIRLATAPEVLESVAASALVGNTEKILRISDTFVQQFANVVVQSFADTAGREADVWTARLQPMLAKAGENLDLTDQQIVTLLNRTRSNVIQNLTRQQRDVIRQTIIRGLQRGDSAERIARRFRNTLGLTNTQLRTLDNYQALLEATSPEALRRDLRNTSFDAQLSRAIDENDVLSAATIQRMVDAYAYNLRNARAEIIATTESLKMVNQARNAAVRQVAERAGIRPSTGRKRWLQTSSAVPRDDHLAMVGEEVGMDEPFVLPSGRRMMYPGDSSLGAGASEIVNCKCGVEYVME